MRKPVNIILGVVVLVLLIALVWHWRPGTEAGPPSSSASSPATTATRSGQTAKPAPIAQVALPVAKPTPAGSGRDADPQAAALQNALTDIADLLRKGDLAAVARNYAPPGMEKEYLEDLQRYKAEGAVGETRLRVMANVFTTLAGQTPVIDPVKHRATLTDRIIYGINPPVPLDKLSPDTDPDTVIRIPLTFQEQNGHWYVSGEALGVLFGALHNVPYGKLSASPAAN
jgi:hypothetical protein